MSLRVAHVVRQFHPSQGGMEDVVYNLAQQQRETHGHRPHVITLDRVFRKNLRLPDVEIFNDIPITRLPYRGSERYPLCPQILHHLADCDVIHVHGIDFFYDFLALTRWHHRRPMIASTHGAFFHTQFAQHLKKFFFHTVTRSSSIGYRRVIATSDNDGDIFSQIIGGERLTVIENGVDINKYADAACTQREPVLLYFGRWSINKGLPETMQLLKLLRERDPRWSLIVAGREYDYTTAQLHEIARANNIANSVEICPNPSSEKIRQLMARASYFISLSQHEGFGLTAVEAMSAGLIPLLSRIPPYVKLARETKAPLLMSKDIAASADAVMSLHNASLSEYKQRKNRALLSAQRFSWTDVAERYAQEYIRACGHTH